MRHEDFPHAVKIAMGELGGDAPNYPTLINGKSVFKLRTELWYDIMNWCGTEFGPSFVQNYTGLWYPYGDWVIGFRHHHHAVAFKLRWG